MQDFEEDGQWRDEKLAVCSANVTAKDLRALTSLQQKHKALEDEMARIHNRFLCVPLATGQDMIKSGDPLADQLIRAENTVFVGLLSKKYYFLKPPSPSCVLKL